MFETALWRSRFIVILAVIFGMIGAIVLFLLASVDVIDILVKTWYEITGHGDAEKFHEHAVSTIIEAIDLYLMAIVLLIFSFGIYELFISKIEAADKSSVGKSILEIKSLDQLKDKLGKVVVMVLVVSFFKRVIHMEYNTPLDMLFFALSIFALAVSLYFLHKGADHGEHGDSNEESGEKEAAH